MLSWIHTHEGKTALTDTKESLIFGHWKCKPIYEAHITTSKSSVSSSVPPAPLVENPSYSLLQDLANSHRISSSRGRDDPHSKHPHHHDQGDQKSLINYARKDTEKGRHVVQLVSHASLDTIDSLIWSEKSMYLKQIDRFHEWTVSAWIPPGGMRFVLLHEIKNDDGIKGFFLEAWESFVRVESSFLMPHRFSPSLPDVFPPVPFIHQLSHQTKRTTRVPSLDTLAYPIDPRIQKGSLLKARRRKFALDGLRESFSACATKAVKLAPEISAAEEQALRGRLVEMYLEENKLKIATREHWTRSETELNWLKDGARRYLAHISRHSFEDHLPLRITKNPSLHQTLREWVDQHVSQKKPMAYILGNIPFGDMTLSVRPPILIPRSETEEWVIKLSENMRAYFEVNRPTCASSSELNSTGNKQTIHHSKPSQSWFKVLDIGTGSGCISNYLAFHHQHVHAVGVDINQDAIGLARENASIHRILSPKSHHYTHTYTPSKRPTPSRVNNGRASFFNFDLFSPTFTKNVLERSQSLVGFDMIVSNPPYITHSDYLNLPSSVKNWESPIALIGDRRFTPLHSHPSLSRGNRPIGEYGFFTSSYQSSSSIGRGIDYTQPTSNEEKEASSTTIQRNTHGIDFYERIIETISKGGLLKTSTNHFFHETKFRPEFDHRLPKVVFEVGNSTQARLIKDILLLRLAPHVISHVEIWSDFSGIQRTVLAY